MGEVKRKDPGKETGIETGKESKNIQQSSAANQPEPVIPPAPAVPEVEDWRMNREWCLNQALDIVRSLKFEVKDVPAFLEAIYRKIVELADDARKRRSL
ncbi:MAG: hypothetical protein AB1847_12340 [bacterium]